jgi:hypothetical protein
LPIENRGNIRGETGFENFLGVRDPRRNARDHFRIFKNLEGFVLGHARILAQVRAQV